MADAAPWGEAPSSYVQDWQATQRRRSPPVDDRGRMKRRRSASPDSYGRNGDYRRDRGDDYYRRDDRDYGRNERYGNDRGYNSNRITAPEDCNYLVSHRHFSDYIEQAYISVFRDKDRLEEAWQNYRTDFLRKQNIAFYEEHKDRPWFTEKYDPAEEELRIRVKAKGRAGKVDAFLAELQNGRLDNLTFDLSPNEAKDKAEVAIEGEDSKQDATMQNGETAEAKDGLGDAKESASKEEEDEQDADKDTTRKPDEDVNMDSKTEKDSRSRPDEFITLPADEWQIVIKAVSADISRTELEEHCGQVDGFDYLALSDPIPGKKYHRVAFVKFKPGTDMQAVEDKLFESKLKDFTLHMNRSNGETKSRIRSMPAFFAEQERATRDLESVQAIVKRYEAESNDTRGSEEITARLALLEESGSEEQTPDSRLKHTLRALDFNLQYLRDCFHTCYYCTTSCDFPEEIVRRCAKHVRRCPDGDKANVRDAGLIKAFDDKVAVMVDPTVDAKQFGGESYDETLHKICTPHIKIEEEGKFRCRTCTKLFKALNFIEKHIANKHPDQIETALNRIKYINNYVLDPNRILPNIPTQAIAEPIRLIPGAYNFNAFPMMFGDMSQAMRLGDRIGNRMDDQPNKRIRRDAMPPDGVKSDPRAARGFASYNDLDSTVPSGDLELEY